MRQCVTSWQHCNEACDEWGVYMWEGEEDGEGEGGGKSWWHLALHFETLRRRFRLFNVCASFLFFTQMQ